MHLISTTSGSDMKAAATRRPPFGPGFSEEEVARAARLDVWGTSIDDVANDYCVFALIDTNGKQVASRRVEGY